MIELFETLKKEAYLTFIREDRWMFFLDGFLMTLLLSISSFILGSLFGIVLCVLKLSKNKRIRKITNAFINFIVQLPTLVLLMVFVYILFRSAPISVVVIIIFGLTLKASAYMADIFYSAVTAVSEVEQEAALNLGLTKFQMIRYLILPQATNNALPEYKNQLINTIQETSIVGYLAIMDLTRASDIVTNRTLDAFFSLIIISILYILIGKIGTMSLDLLQNKKHLGGNIND